jgi:N-acetylglutamate synthase-like GNAT family acetyltransferase
MSVAIEKLAPDKFDELYQFADGYVPDPKLSWAFVARKDGRIVGRIFILAPAHVEGPYIEPEERRGTIGARLMQILEKEALDIGISKLFAYANSPQIEDYLSRLGYIKSAMTVWEKEI